MTTVEPIERTHLKAQSPMIQHLERNNRELLHLGDKLHSYICEPKTYLLFENSENLKGRLMDLQRANQGLMDEIKEINKPGERHMERCQKQFEAYLELEQEVIEYIELARVH